MSDESHNADNDEIHSEYDFSQSVRGKYADRFAEGTNLILVQPDVPTGFPDSESVNEALRSLLESRKNKPGRESA